jgi:cadmium resistance protein CadD (predicted permease)
VTWPHFREASPLQAVVFLIVFFIAANVCYSAAYLVDIALQGSSLRAQWQRWRLGLWLIGTGLAFVFTNYWFADEIYPYVR